MRENSATRKVSFLDQQHEHSASVALATRISKDPKGSPTSENITENYQKTVSTNFKMRKPKIEKRHREEEEEEGEEKEDPSLHYINQEEVPLVDPYVEEMWNRIMMLEAQSQPQTRNKLPLNVIEILRTMQYLFRKLIHIYLMLMKTTNQV